MNYRYSKYSYSILPWHRAQPRYTTLQVFQVPSSSRESMQSCWLAAAQEARQTPEGGEFCPEPEDLAFPSISD